MSAALTPNPEAAIAFLELLRPGGPWALTAITPDGPTTTETFFKAAAAVTWIERENATRNIYLMVAETAGVLRKKASKADVARSHHLWADLDGDGDLRGRLNGHVPPPTMTVASGGGLNLYWALAQPIEDTVEIEARNRWLAQNLAGDHCWNCDRILRLPGTINWPNAKKKSNGRTPVLARCTEYHPDRIYDFNDFGRVEADEAKDHKRIELGDEYPASDPGRPARRGSRASVRVGAAPDPGRARVRRIQRRPLQIRLGRQRRSRSRGRLGCPDHGHPAQSRAADPCPHPGTERPWPPRLRSAPDRASA